MLLCVSTPDLKAGRKPMIRKLVTASVATCHGNRKSDVSPQFHNRLFQPSNPINQIAYEILQPRQNVFLQHSYCSRTHPFLSTFYIILYVSHIVTTSRLPLSLRRMNLMMIHHVSNRKRGKPLAKTKLRPTLQSFRTRCPYPQKKTISGKSPEISNCKLSTLKFSR